MLVDCNHAESVLEESMKSLASSLAVPEVVLASNSPRRRDIISALEACLECVESGFVEGDRSPAEEPEQFARRLARGKATAVASRRQHGIVIGADTIVTLDGNVMGKPDSEHEAAGMLERLRGRAHHVYTAVCAVDAETGRSTVGGADTLVTMREYTDAELEAYVASGEPYDKAGAYGVQDRKFRPARLVDGCYLNVVGLPLCVTVQLINELGVTVHVVPDWRPPDGCRPCEVSPSAHVNIDDHAQSLAAPRLGEQGARAP